MRDFQLPKKVDAVLCEFGAVNHVPYKSDLKLVAQSASRALAPEGHFSQGVSGTMAEDTLYGEGGCPVAAERRI